MYFFYFLFGHREAWHCAARCGPRNSLRYSFAAMREPIDECRIAECDFLFDSFVAATFFFF